MLSESANGFLNNVFPVWVSCSFSVYDVNIGYASLLMALQLLELQSQLYVYHLVVKLETLALLSTKLLFDVKLDCEIDVLETFWSRKQLHLGQETNFSSSSFMGFAITVTLPNCGSKFLPTRSFRDKGALSLAIFCSFCHFLHPAQPLLVRHQRQVSNFGSINM